MKHLWRVCRILLVAAFWIALWAFSAWRVGKPLLFPSPLAVLTRLWELAQTKEFYTVVGNSLWSVLSGILIAVLLGSILSALTAHVKVLRDLLLPIMTVIKATPVASFIILALIWIGAKKVPTFITILIVLPLIWTNLDVGFSKIDRGLWEVAKVYKMPFWRRWTTLTLPSLKPYFVSACRSALGLAWKAGIAAEIIASPRNTIGTMIGDAKQYILTADMFAWTLTVILLSLVIEFVFSALLTRLGKDSSKTEVSAC